MLLEVGMHSCSYIHAIHAVLLAVLQSVDDPPLPATPGSSMFKACRSCLINLNLFLFHLFY